MQNVDHSRGFTLIEMLVAAAVLVVVFIGVLGMLESSSRVSKVESELADVQENVRYATYALVRAARTAGGTNLPLAQMVGGNLQWVSLQILDNQSGSFTDDQGGNHTPFPGSDVLVVRGFFQYPVYFVDPELDVDLSAGTVIVRGTTGSGLTQLVPTDVAAITGKGLALIGHNQYAVAKVTGGSLTGGNMTIQFSGGGGDIWDSLNPGGSYTSPGFDVYQVGILDSYAFFVDNSKQQLMRWRAGASGGVTEPVALDVGGLQVALELMVDTNGDGTPDTPQWFYTATSGAPSDPQAADSTPMKVRLTVLGRTSFPVISWREPMTTFDVENMNPATVTAAMRRAKWRTLQVQAALRDFVL